VCAGTTATCPADAFATAGTLCRGSAGECDTAEVCSGAGPNCPADTKLAAGTTCTDDGNPCTVDQCDGTRIACQHPAGNAGAVCRAAAGVCDVAESCDGTSAACPADRFAPSTTQCRAPAGVCDSAELCPGNGPACPADSKVLNGTPCSDSSLCTTGDICQAGACTGTPVTCPASDQCHAAGTCDPASGTCSNPVVANGTTCND